MSIESPFCPLIDTKQAAEIVGLPYSVMLGMRRKGEGPTCVKAGRKYMYEFDTVVAWRKTRWATPQA